MAVAALIAADAGLYERKHAAIDAGVVGIARVVGQQTAEGRWQLEGNELTAGELARALRGRGIRLVHVYGDTLPLRVLQDLRAPYLAAHEPPKRRWPMRSVAPPAASTAAASLSTLPEAVEESWFARGALRRPQSDQRTIGSVRRATTAGIEEAVFARLQRTRDDLAWRRFDRYPERSELSTIDLWLDPAADERDADGFTAEALAAGLPVVATRSLINEWRLERGTAGLLVKLDPNELAHAILRTLFKAETLEEQRARQRESAERFRPELRVAALTRLYRRLAP